MISPNNLFFIPHIIAHSNKLVFEFQSCSIAVLYGILFFCCRLCSHDFIDIHTLHDLLVIEPTCVDGELCTEPVFVEADDAHKIASQVVNMPFIAAVRYPLFLFHPSRNVSLTSKNIFTLSKRRNDSSLMLLLLSIAFKEYRFCFVLGCEEPEACALPSQCQRSAKWHCPR